MTYAPFVKAAPREELRVIDSVHWYNKFFDHSTEMTRFFKRNVVTKKYQDPCIQQCRFKMFHDFLEAIGRSVARQDDAFAKANRNLWASDEIMGEVQSVSEKETAELQKWFDETLLASNVLMFADLCSAAMNCTDCISYCPQSQYLSIIQGINSEDYFCESQRYWTNFTEFQNAASCANETVFYHSCDDNCGAEVTIENAASFQSDEAKDKSSYTFTFEKDAEKNTAAIGLACKSLSCHIEWYKSIISKSCGSKAYEMFARRFKIKPRWYLKTLEIMNAFNGNEECKFLLTSEENGSNSFRRYCSVCSTVYKIRLSFVMLSLVLYSQYFH